MKRILAVVALPAVALVAVLAGCQSKTSKLYHAQQTITNQYQQQLTTARPYPLSQMADSAERENLTERLLRLNDPNKVGYFYGLSSTGQVMAFFVIKGKPSSMGSQLTNTNTIINGAAIESMGDDGSYGPEECSSQGVFFFTADTNALQEWCGPWSYSDQPYKLSTAPLIVEDSSAKPSSTAGVRKP